MNKPVVINFLHRVLQHFLRSKEIVLKEADMRAEKIKIKFEIIIEGYTSGVNWKSRVNEYSGNMLSDGVSFDKAHLQALQTVDDVESCVRAIAILAYKLILRECSEYKNEKVFIREYPKEGNLNNLEFIKIGYSAESENPKYAPPAEW